MGYIYIVRNDINDKVYIGQTVNTLEVRWRRHKYRAKHNEKKSHFQNALNKYGDNHFFISLIEECPNEELNEREKYWIRYYDSFKNGYNSTIGGEGATKHDISEIEKFVKLGLSIPHISELLDIPYSTLIEYAHQFDKDFKTHSKRFTSSRASKSVSMYSLDGVFIKTFTSMLEASNETGVSLSSISNCCKGRRNFGGKYQWKYGDSNKDIQPKPISSKMGYPVIQCSLDGTEIAKYDSILSAYKQTGIHDTAIGMCCRNKRKTAGGYIWKRG